MHDLRHGALREMAEHSPNLAGIVHLAGHKNLQTTERFVQSKRRSDARSARCAAFDSGYR